MRRVLCLCLLSHFFMGSISAKEQLSPDARFDKYKERFVLRLWEMYPGWASSVGYHKYDDRLVVPDDAARQREVAFCNANLDSLAKFNVQELSDANKTDYYLIENQLKYSIWGVKEQKAYTWDPSGYNVSGGFADMLNNDYAPLEKRLRNFSKRLVHVPSYYRAAQKNISNPTVEHTALAIEQNLGGISVFEQDLKDAMARSSLSDKEKDLLRKRAADAVAAIRSYVAWLKELKNDHPRSFRLGKELYDAKFGFEIQSGYSAEQIYRKAIEHKKELHEKMYRITKRLWPKYFIPGTMPSDKLAAIRQMIDELSEKHVKPDEFQ